MSSRKSAGQNFTSATYMFAISVLIPFVVLPLMVTPVITRGGQSAISVLVLIIGSRYLSSLYLLGFTLGAVETYLTHIATEQRGRLETTEHFRTISTTRLVVSFVYSIILILFLFSLPASLNGAA